MKARRLHVLLVVLGLVLGLIPFHAKFKSLGVSAIQALKSRKSVAERVAEFGGAVHRRLGPRFEEIGVAYPPRRLVIVGLKQERVVEIWVPGQSGGMRYLKSYPILAASGGIGPKLAEGDLQVPEGRYRIESLNPNSLYHLALRVDYPNEFDRMKGKEEGRTDLGSDIMIHGKSASMGCLAIGDPAIEELFVLAAEVGLENIDVVLCPLDFRTRNLTPPLPGLPQWTLGLYADLRKDLERLKR